MKTKIETIRKRRQREGKTDYKKRIKILLSGKPRLVVRKSLRNITAQIVIFEEKGDRVLVGIRSDALADYGWKGSFKNLPSAYLLGALVSKKAKEQKISHAILDIGLNKSVPGCKFFAVLKGAIDNGIDIPHSKDVLPSDERVSGKHIQDFAKKLSGDEQEYSKRFGEYRKNDADPAKIEDLFKSVKSKIIGA